MGTRIIGISEAGHRLVLKTWGENVKYRSASVKVKGPGEFIAGLDRFNLSDSLTASFGVRGGVEIATATVPEVNKVETGKVQVSSVLSELKGEELREKIGLPVYLRGTAEFDELVSRLKEKRVYVADGSDISEAGSLSPVISNRMLSKSIEFAPNAMREIFGDAQKCLDESLKIAGKFKQYWEKNGWKTAFDCPAIISLDELRAFMKLLERKNFYRGGAWYHIHSYNLLYYVQISPDSRSIHVAGGVI